MHTDAARPGIVVARHSAPDREGTTVGYAVDGRVDVLWFDTGETEPVLVGELMEVVKLDGERTTVEAAARNPLAELLGNAAPFPFSLMGATPGGGVVVVGADTPPEVVESLRERGLDVQTDEERQSGQDDDPDEDLPYRLEYLEDVAPGMVLLIPVECRNMRCRRAHHERQCQVLEVRERGEVYSVKALDPDGKQVPLRADAITLVKVHL